MLYIFNILLYVLLVIFIVFSFKLQINQRELMSNSDNPNIKQYRKKIDIWKILILSLIVGLYAIYSFPEELGGDHYNYAFRFVGFISIYSESIGLGIIYDFLWLFTNNKWVMFYFTITLSIFIVLMGTRRFLYITPFVILMLFASEYIVYGFAALKQALANAWAVIFFVYYFNGKKIKGIIFLIMAIIFHVAALVLIPIYFLLNFAHKKRVQIIFYISIISLLLFFPLFATLGVWFVDYYFPNFSRFLNAYVDENRYFIIESNMVILKGIPFYILTVFAFLYKKRLKFKIEHYDKYIFILVLISTFFLLSFYSYWIFRFAYLLFVPAFVFLEKLLKNVKDQGNKFFLKLSTVYLIMVLTLYYMLLMFFRYGGL